MSELHDQGRAGDTTTGQRVRAAYLADKDAVDKVLKTLTYQERVTVEMIFGLGDDGYAYTIEEVGRVFKLMPEEMREVAVAAIRKLQPPSRHGGIEAFVDAVTAITGTDKGVAATEE